MMFDLGQPFQNWLILRCSKQFAHEHTSLLQINQSKVHIPNYFPISNPHTPNHIAPPSNHAKYRH